MRGGIVLAVLLWFGLTIAFTASAANPGEPAAIATLRADQARTAAQLEAEARRLRIASKDPAFRAWAMLAEAEFANDQEHAEAALSGIDQAIAQADALKLPFETNRKIGPEACVSELIAASGWPQAKGAVLIVGHQPSLGRMASLLLAGQEAEWSIKKGALWWLTNRVRRGDAQTVLRAMIPVELLD